MRYVLAMLMMAGMIAVSHTQCSARDEVLRIGVIAELTGDMPAVGESCTNAAKLAVKQINDAGGIEVGGKKLMVKLAIEDNGGRADQSAAAAMKLITQQEVAAIVGPNASRYAIPAAEIAESMQTVLITPWSTNPKTTRDAATDVPKNYVFRACFIDPFQGGVLARFVKDNLKLDNAAVLYDVASEYNKGIAEMFKDAFVNLGGKIVAFETYTTNDKDFTAQLTKIKSAAPDIVFLPNYYSEVPLQVQQAHRLGLTVPFLGSDSWGSNELLTLGGRELEGYYFSTHYAADSAAPAAVSFIDAYKAAYGKVPDDVAALTYDSFGLLWTAIRNGGSAERQSIRNALAELPDYNGVTGEMRFVKGSGDPIKSAVIIQIKDGKFTYHANVGQ